MTHLSTRRRLLTGGAALLAGTAAARAGLLAPKQLGSDGVAGRQLATRLQDAINFRDYLLPTDTQSSDAVDRCIAAQPPTTYTGRPRAIYFPAGVYPPLIRTHKFPQFTTLVGDGPENTIFLRSTNYGSTFQFGDNGSTTTGGIKVAAGRVNVRGMQIIHGTAYQFGDTALSTIATAGAHLELNGAQDGMLDDLLLQRMPYSVQINGGPGGVTIGRMHTIGVWDDTLTACQEGVASLQIQYSALWGNPKSMVVENAYFQGQRSAVRSKTWSDNNGHSVSSSQRQNIGFQHNVLVLACEELHVSHCYIGCANVNNITVLASATSGALTRDIHIGGGTFFDSAGNAEIALQAASAAAIIDNVQIGDCTMDGELAGLTGILVSAAADASGPSVVNAKISPSVIEHYVGAGMILQGLTGSYVGGCRITDYNCLNIPSTTDASRDAAICVFGSCRDLLIDQISAGGGGNYDAPAAAGGNYSHRGVVVDSGLSGAGITVGSNVRFNAPT